MSKRVPGTAGLIPVKKQIKGKHPYLAIRYVSPGEAEQEVKEYLAGRKKESYRTRYLRKHPLDVNVITQQELKIAIPKKDTGEQYYAGANVKLIKRIIEFKKPHEVEGLERIVCLIDGEQLCKYDNAIKQKRRKKKFVRCKNIGKKIEDFRANYQLYLKSEGTELDRQLGAVLGLMDNHLIRVGSGKISGIQEGLIKVETLKRGMVISHPSWAVGTPPHIIVEEKTPEGIKKVFIRSLARGEEESKLRDYRKQIKVLTRKVQKDPSNKEQKFELQGLKIKEKELASEIHLPVPSNWTEVIRIGHYGATQLEARHVKYPAPGEVWLDFIGKSGVRWNFKINDTLIAKAVRDLQKGKADKELLFPDIERSDVARELKKYKMLPKDFRTFSATKAFVEATKDYPVPTTEKELKEIEKELFKTVSIKLWNTPGMAKKAYVDTTVYANWRSGLLNQIVTSVQKSYIILL
jgi:DNA topoisomerase IB